MPLTANDILYGFAAPAGLGAVVFFIVSRWFPEAAGRRLAGSLALVGGYLLGYFLLELGPLAASSHWHWMPFAVLAALAVGPPSRAAGTTRFERALLYALAAAVTVWLTVPTYDHVLPVRHIYLGIGGAAILLLAFLIEWLATRLGAATLATALTAILVAGAVVLALSGSLRFAQMLGAASGAMIGIAVASCVGKGAASLEGLGAAYGVLVVGMMLIGQVKSTSELPHGSYALIAAAPVALLLATIGPAARWSGAKRFFASVSAVVVVCGAAIGLAATA